MGATVGWAEKKEAQERARVGATLSIFTNKGKRDRLSQNSLTFNEVDPSRPALNP